MTDDALDLRTILSKAARFCTINIRWLTRGIIVVIALLILLHQVYAPSVEWLGEILGMAKPSLATVLGLVTVVFILERVIVLHELIEHRPINIDQRRVSGYKRLSELVGERGAKRVDLLQVSGHTAVPFLRDLAEHYPKAEVRLLLMGTAAVARFDQDHNPDHKERVVTTVQELEVMRADYPGFDVTIKYYDTAPGISAVVVDNDIVSLSWYYCFKDSTNPDIVRVRGHLSPTVTVAGEEATQLVAFARERFEMLWQTAVSSNVAEASNSNWSRRRAGSRTSMRRGSVAGVMRMQEPRMSGRIGCAGDLSVSWHRHRDLLP